MSPAAAKIYDSIFSDEAGANASEERMLDAALDVIIDYGFRHSSLEEVARRAGISRVTIYRKFADKDALMQAVILREVRRSLSSIVRESSALVSAEDRFVRGFVLTITVARAHPLFKRILSGESEIVLPRYIALSASQAIDLGREIMGGIIRQMQKEGHFPGLDPAYLAELLIRLWHSIVLTPSSLVAHDEKALTAFARGFLFPLLSPKVKKK